jgi:hypothetical protein
MLAKAESDILVSDPPTVDPALTLPSVNLAANRSRPAGRFARNLEIIRG